MCRRFDARGPLARFGLAHVPCVASIATTRSPSGWNNIAFKVHVHAACVTHDLRARRRMKSRRAWPGHDGKPEAVMKLGIERAGMMTPAEYDPGGRYGQL